MLEVDEVPHTLSPVHVLGHRPLAIELARHGDGDLNAAVVHSTFAEYLLKVLDQGLLGVVQINPQRVQVLLSLCIAARADLAPQGVLDVCNLLVKVLGLCLEIASFSVAGGLDVKNSAGLLDDGVDSVVEPG